MKPEYLIYLDKAKRTLAEARYLMNGGFFEAAVGRAYYAMFHAVEALLEQRQIDAASHHALITLFGREYVRSGILPAEFGRRLSIAFERRQAADYNLGDDHSEEIAAEVIQWAEEFLAAAQQLLQNAP